MNAINVSTIRPGLLVNLGTSLRGNVRYSVQEIVRDHIDPETGARRAKWDTERLITDPDEHDRAVKARGSARSAITATCAQSAHGLLCPQDKEDRLRNAIREAQQIVDEFNAGATLTQISLNVLVGRVAADDVTAIRSINKEVRELLEDMQEGLRKLDVQAVRDAATKAKNLSTMLSPAAAERAQQAIDVARAAARQIKKAGETVAIEIDQATLNTIRTARMAFLDLDDATEVQAPVATGRAVDLDIEYIPTKTPGPGLLADLDL